MPCRCYYCVLAQHVCTCDEDWMLLVSVIGTQIPLWYSKL